MKLKFYVCEHCGNLVKVIKDSGVPMMCCGQKMAELVPGTSDGALEKHVPVVVRNGGRVEVNVGSVDHPMIPEHYIEWIALETKAGNQRKVLKPNEAPHAVFYIAEDDEIIEKIGPSEFYQLVQVANKQNYNVEQW